MNPPDVSVVIVNYNGLRFLPECLDTVRAAFTRYSAEVIVIDNASVDGSQAFLRTRPDIRYIESTENLGFTGGNNRAAREATGRVLLLLNNDTRCDGSLDALIDEALQPEVGVAGCHLVYGDGRLQFSVGFEHTPVRIALSWLGLEKQWRTPDVFRRVQTRPGFYAQSSPSVDWVSGACLATRREVWERLGGLDDAFFMYCEDVDYGRRVRQLGLRASYRADVTVTHYEGAGKAWAGRATVLRTLRSYLLFVTKHFGRGAASRLALSLGLVFSAKALAHAGRAVLSQTAERRALQRDKRNGYFNAAQQSFAAWWKQAPVVAR
jgi:GT2 family glycosyltransferase